MARGHRRRRHGRIRSRSRRASAWPFSSPDPRSSRRNRYRRHAWQPAAPLERVLIGDQRPAPQEVGRLAAMRAWGGRAATVGTVEAGEKRRPWRASAHAACPSPCSRDAGAGPCTVTGDAPERDGRTLAARGHPWKRTDIEDGGYAPAASTTQSLTANDQGRIRRDRTGRRDRRTSALPSSSPDPRSSRRNRHRLHA